MPRRRPSATDQSDNGPPPKKRKVAAAPKERTTEYLDLTKPDNHFTQFDEEQRQRLITALKKKKKIVVIAGAGISVSANIPDFRSSAGLFAPAGSQKQSLKASGKHLFDASVYKRDELTEEFHTMVREIAKLSADAQPTPFHHLLASLAKEGRLLRLYTQNIDCVDTSMPPLATNVPLNSKAPWPKTIQLHGGLQKMVCTKCGKLQPLDRDLFVGPETPLCKTCEEDDQVRTLHAGRRSHGIGRLRPRFVLYNEFNPDGEAIGNVCSADLKTRPDAVLVVGTSLKVPGTRRLVKELCQVTRGRRDGFTAWINIDPEPKGVDFKDCWDLVVRSKCDNVAMEVALPPWDCEIGDDYILTPEDELLQARQKIEVQCLLKQSILTPSSSPKISVAMPPAKKTKQIKLPYGKPSTTPASNKPTKAAPKSRGQPRKPLPASQPKKVTDSFKTGKNISNRPASKGKILLPKKDEIDLPALRPPRKSPVEDIDIPHMSEANEAETGDLSSPRPSTPTGSAPILNETISPKSVPRGLQALIDV